MRLELETITDRADQEVSKVYVTLSRRNLLSLLVKLDGYPPWSECELRGPAGSERLVVRAEEDAPHYANEHRGTAVGVAGAMHPDTERAMPTDLPCRGCAEGRPCPGTCQ